MLLSAPLTNATSTEFLEYLGFSLSFLAIVLVVFSGVPYVLESIAYYRMAQLRKIPRAWLAWIPIGRGWIMGSISDHYQEKVNKKITNRRKWLLILGIVAAVLGILFGICFCSMLVQMITDAGVHFMDITEDFTIETKEMSLELISISMRMLAVLFFLSVASILLTVFHYMALFDVFQSCDPSVSTLFFILSIAIPLFASGLTFVVSILIFICRFRNYGIPRVQPEGYPGHRQEDWQQPDSIKWQHDRPDDPWKL